MAGRHRIGRFARLAAGAAAIVALAACRAFAAHDPRDYRPPQFPDADNHLKVPFLVPEREWERIDIYVPKNVPGERLPCIVLIYGGGWGGKVTHGADEMRALLARGYVVALPDYVLGAANPVPSAVWDGAAAIRFLRAKAAAYRLDPERIGAWGLSAGGWLIQYLAPSDSSTVLALQPRGGRAAVHVPMLEPRPLYADQSAKVQALVSDWGAGRLAEKQVLGCPAWITGDDPPLHTCHNDPGGAIPPGPQRLIDVGVPVEVALVDTKNTHVPSPSRTSARAAHGGTITYRQSIHRFLDRFVKDPKDATPPEMFPQGGPIAGPTRVAIRSVHAGAAIRFTTDGTDPTAASPAYREPVAVQPGDTLKAIAVKPGLKPSRAAAAVFTRASAAAPVITTPERALAARRGVPFSFTFQARSALPVEWYILGKTALSRVPNTNPPRPAPWMAMDPASGTLSGTPDAAGVCPIIVVANARDGQTILWDAVAVVITVE
jgi:LysM repeat protein